jgi:hypothetical protein
LEDTPSPARNDDEKISARVPESYADSRVKKKEESAKPWRISRVMELLFSEFLREEPDRGKKSKLLRRSRLLVTRGEIPRQINASRRHKTLNAVRPEEIRAFAPRAGLFMK